MAVEIDRSVAGEKWRYACPRGHTDWRLRDGVIACRSCPHPKLPGEVEYDVVIDQRTGETIDVEEVRVA